MNTIRRGEVSARARGGVHEVFAHPEAFRGGANATNLPRTSNGFYDHVQVRHGQAGSELGNSFVHP